MLDVFYDGQTPSRQYTPITIIRVKVGDGNDGPRIIAQLRKEARIWGAEAVIMSTRGSYSHCGGGSYGNIAWSSSSGGDIIEAIGVIYNDHPDGLGSTATQFRLAPSTPTDPPPPTPLEQMQTVAPQAAPVGAGD